MTEILDAVSGITLESREPAFDGLPGPLLTFVLLTTDDRELDILAYGVGARNELDTFGGSFTKGLVSHETPTAGTAFRFTDEQLRQIYGLLRGIDITRYPVEFIPADDDQYWVTPNQTYYLRLRAGGHTSEIRWDDQNESRIKQAADPRRVIRRIQEMIEGTDTYKALHGARGGYL